MSYKKPWSLMEGYSLAGSSYRSPLRVIGPLNGKTLRLRVTLNDEGDHLSSMPQHISKKFPSINPRGRVRGICQCYLSSSPSSRNWFTEGKLNKFDVIGRQSRQSKHTTVIRTQADYKAEEYDITGEKLDSGLSSELPNESILVEGLQQKPWWEQFPKRWVIVLLCFSAFLLCNMDRVSYHMF